MKNRSIWLRCETKKNERRTPLIPAHAQLICNTGIKLFVERSDERIYSNEEYETAGCELVEPGSWVNADKNCYVIGLKELPSLNHPISQQHIYFAHAFKKQAGSDLLLSQFKQGGGTILDYEFLLDCFNQRVVTGSFSYWAGFCGAAISLFIWDDKQKKQPYSIPLFYQNENNLITELEKRITTWSSLPKILIIGANGFSGKGARALFNRLNITPDLWFRHHTKNKGPFSEALEYDMLVNCINLTTKIKPFITKELLDNNKQLSIITDVSCDVTSRYNPLPIYHSVTTFMEPAYRVESRSQMPIDLIGIDHLASFLPKESSDAFSSQLLPFLLQLVACGPHLEKSVWKNAIKKYEDAIQKLG